MTIWSNEAEQAVLGGLMLDRNALAKVADWLTPQDFHSGVHRALYEAILEQVDRGCPTDAVTLLDAVEGLIDDSTYVIQLAATTPSAANVVAWAEIVREKSKLRAMLDEAAKVQAACQRGEEADKVAIQAARAFGDLSGPSKGAGIKTMREVGSEWFAALQQRWEGTSLGLPTPWGELNRKTGGFNPGDLIILAGRPGMGKSAAALNMGLAWAMAQKRTMVFSLEMTRAAIYNRCVAAIEDIPLAYLKDPRSADEAMWPRVSDAVKKLQKAAMVIDDQPRLTLQQIAMRARREHLKSPLSAIVVDHMHIMALPNQTRQDIEYGEVSGGFKALAKELGVPVIALAQLNRSVEKRDNKRPMMSDLREAGSFEQDADLILFMYRDDYYAQQTGGVSSFPGLAECIIAKNREGEQGKVWLRSRLDVGRFDECDEPVEMPQQPERRRRFQSDAARAYKDN